MGVGIFIVYSIIWAIVCHIIASDKGIEGLWFLWGLLFGVFALIVLLTKQSSSPNNLISNTSPADELKKYKELFEQGAITESEFDAIKKQLLKLIYANTFRGVIAFKAF
ncbi:MAG: SHOCT domain-containing protein [Lachnospiraceae bacterium]|nr:SHOCT domain-containing protein [Lachnospiraceae bacterium]